MSFLLVVGAPRSGTTLLQAMLNSHSQIALPPESHLLPRLAALRPAVDRVPFSVPAFTSVVLEKGRIQNWPESQDLLVEHLSLANPESLSEATEELFRWFASRQGASVFGDKTPNNTLHLPSISRLLPGSKVLAIERSPYSVITSIASAEGFGPNDLRGASWLWAEYTHRLRTFSQLVGPDRFHQVSYSNLIGTPESTLDDVCGFLGLKFEVEMLDFSGAGSELSAGQRFPTNHSNLTGGLRPEREVSDALKLEIRRHLAAAAAVYPLSGGDDGTPGQKRGVMFGASAHFARKAKVAGKRCRTLVKLVQRR